MKKEDKEITPLEKDLNTFYEKFERKSATDSFEDKLVYRNVPFGLAKDFKLECDKIILENSLNLKSDLISENGVFFNQFVISKK